MEINLDTIVNLLRTEHGIENAYVEQTGGGCATIYAGPTVPDTENDPTGEYGDKRYAAVAGPGSYGWGERPSVADTDEFYVGPDNQDGNAIDVDLIGAWDEVAVAKVIAAQARKQDPTTPLTTDEVQALGYDGTGRGII